MEIITSNFGWTTSNIVFEWNLNDQAYIIDHILLKISKTWYSPFIDYLCKVDRWQRNSWMIISTTIASASSNYYGGGFDGNGGIFLNVIENCLVGFKYLYDFHWNLMDDDLLGLYNEKGEDDEVEMNMDEGEDNNEEEEDLTEYYNGLVEDYKAYAIKKHGNKLLTSVKNWYENKISQLSFKDSIKMSSSSSYPYIRKYAPATTTAWTQKQTELQAGY
ncbi:21189_t:CDS:2 [Entrophospora sp. SA101]|nr:21189_t:CDS:2 [Entrophospora sp. SA101]CAJ0917521.1 22243_t:CDS:2 [Entrophospora sp. SA101]